MKNGLVAIGLPFFPFVSGIILIVLSMVLLLYAFRGRSTGIQAFGDVWRPATLIIGLAFYSIILDFIGYAIGTIIPSAFVMHVLDTKT